MVAMLAATQPRAGTALLTKRGTPLGNAWLAAHLEKKLHKGQIIKTDVHGTVAEVIEMENGQLALRISGHLLLGVVRIFSRQVDYLLDDAKEAVIRVRLAFKPTTVDMAQDASTANRRFDELTLPANQAAASALTLELDDYAVPAFETLELPALGASGARRDSAGAGLGSAARDRTLADVTLDDGAADPFALEPAGGEFGFGPSDDFELFDAGRRDGGALGTPAGARSAARAASGARGRNGVEDEEEEEVLRRDTSARRSRDGAGIGLALGDDLELELPRDELQPGGMGLSQMPVELDLPPSAFDAPEQMDADGGYGADGYENGGDYGGALDLLHPGDGEDTLDIPLANVMGAADGTPAAALRAVLLIAAGGGGTPTLQLDLSGRKRRGGRKGAGGAAARSAVLLRDAETQLGVEVIRQALADAGPTIRAPPAAPPTVATAAGGRGGAAAAEAAEEATAAEIADALAARARALGSTDAAAFFASAVFSGEPADLGWAYQARPFLAPAVRASAGKRRRGSDAASTPAPEEEEAPDGASGRAEEGADGGHAELGDGYPEEETMQELLEAHNEQFPLADAELELEGGLEGGAMLQLDENNDNDYMGQQAWDGRDDGRFEPQDDEEVRETYGIELPAVDGAEDMVGGQGADDEERVRAKNN